MTMKTKLAHAVTMALAGTALSVGGISTANAAATTMYNTYNAFAAATPTDGVPPDGTQSGGTDGWVYGFGNAPSSGVSPGFVGIGGSASVSTSTPFGYAGGAPVNWAAQFTGGTDSATVSQADAFTRYGVYADIDTAKGAWSDASLGGASGWRHNLDYGLFKSDVGGTITLSASGLTQGGTNFGFTIFKGMDASTGAYNHHGPWNSGNNSTGLTANSLPGGGSNFGGTGNIVAYSVGGSTPSNLNTITFTADPGQVYTIVLGGYRNGAWGDTADGYVLNVSSAAPVPIPAAVWLFGSALAGLGVIGRRKDQAAT